MLKEKYTIKIAYTQIKYFVLFIILIELFLFGSGHVINLSESISFRILIFILMILMGCIGFVFLNKRLNIRVLYLAIFYAFITTLSIFVGYENGSRALIFVDVKTLIYFFSIIYFYLTIRNIEDIDFVIKVLIKCTFYMAILYVIYVILFKFGVFNFKMIFGYLKNMSDFKFRGESGLLFYKGFIFLPIGLFFCNLYKGPYSFQSISIVFAIFFTETRGFWILGLLSYFFYFLYKLIKNKYKIKISSILLYTAIIILILFVMRLNFSELSGDRVAGDNLRIETMNQVFEMSNLLTLFIGHGFGIGVPIRPVHMEMSFLEIFHKQGLLGLFFWVFILVDSVLIYYNSKDYSPRSTGFVVSIILIYIQSLFNPYLTNSMGIGFVVIAYVSLMVIYKEKKLSF